MGFDEINLKYKYRSDTDSLQKDFYNVVLRKAVKYDRAVGYFTSNSIAILAEGLINFIEREGKIRIVCNPYLSAQDYEAIREGYKSREKVIEESLLRELELSSGKMNENPLSVLSWLISLNKLDIKIAYTEENAIYHEKFGIFYDENSKAIAFSGSSNETMGGLVSNFEKIDVYFRDYEEQRITDAINDFDLLWRNETEGLIIEDFPLEVKNYMLSKKSVIKPKKDKFKLRPYQKDAIEAFVKNGRKGIFDMGTGTGKTITSLYCAKDYLKENKRIFIIVLVPYSHLVEQWHVNLELVGFSSVIECFGSKKVWVDKLGKSIRNFNIGISNKGCAIAVYKTATSDDFQELIQKISRNAFIIADECHNFGIPGMSGHKFDHIEARLGLSATPERWWDEKGTNALFRYFGNIIFSYGIEAAIQSGALVEYKYHPITVDLEESENEKYEKYTLRISRMANRADVDEDELKMLLIKRSRIISNAVNKKHELLRLLKNAKEGEMSHTLVYCGPGEIDEITMMISGLGFGVHRFDSKISVHERARVLSAFEKGDIQILVAIKCLDEGIDVPSIKRAYFLASTSNPREFIQRRGRVLRPDGVKTSADIYDFIVMPTTHNHDIDRSIISKEMPRFAEFSRFAINNYSARNSIREILAYHELEHLMDKLPWEVYKEMKENFGGENGY